MADERELVRLALHGERAAFEQLYAAHARRVLAYLYRCGFAPATADDLVQETFLSAYASLETFDGERGGFSAWVGGIARNAARKHWARRKDGESFDPALAEQVLAGGEEPAETAESNEEISAVRACVETLPEELRRIVRLRYVDGRTTRGVAAAAGLPEATVRLRLEQAGELLARCLRSKGVLE